MELIINKQKFKIFLEITRELNNSFNVTPILYGSLGLYRLIGEHSSVNDTDILVPEDFLKLRWRDLISLMERLNFKLKDEKEHEFIRNKKLVGFAGDKDLVDMVNIDPSSLKISKVKNAKFKELSVKQYLLLYQNMLRDNYRQEKLEKEDKVKIKLIKDFLKH